MANINKIKYLLNKHKLDNADLHDYKELADLVDDFIGDTNGK